MSTSTLAERVLSPNELDRLLRAPKRAIALRNAAIVALYGSHVRPGAQRHLRVEHAVALCAGEQLELGPSGSDRTVLLGARARAALRAYLEHGRPLLAKTERPELLLSPGGRPLKACYMGRAVQRAFERAGIPYAGHVRGLLSRTLAELDPVSPRPSSRRVPAAPAAPAVPVVPPRESEKREQKRATMKAFIAAVKKAARGCKDCGAHAAESFSELTFDHLPGHEKRFNLASAAQRSLEAVKAEIKKCELVCVPCHRAREKARGR
ncbi:hypothetical protein HY251_22115 [bacterium]|nr:hypothetical protein [bacterium]